MKTDFIQEMSSPSPSQPFGSLYGQQTQSIGKSDLQKVVDKFKL